MPENSIIQIENKIHDGGPIYAETNPDNFPVEPLASITNLIFLFIIFFWSNKTRLNYRKYPLITIALPLIGVGFIGGTVYHLFRSDRAWLVLDYMPILILVFAGGLYLWAKVLKSRFLAILLTAVPLLVLRFLFPRVEIPHNLKISIGYAMMSTILCLPAILHCVFRYRKGWKTLLAAGLSFIVAILCRSFDIAVSSYIPFGLHFMWHIFGGLAVFFMIAYIYGADNKEAEASSTDQNPVSADCCPKQDL